MIEQRLGRATAQLDRPPAVATPLGDLPRGRLHEWLGVVAPRGQPWLPPLGVMLDLVGRALTQTPDHAVLWIGRATWPYFPGAAAERIRRQSLLIDAPDARRCLWASEVALRCPAVAAVIADASGFELVATRRLQLAAEASRALLLTARPAAERRQRSAAAYRWRVAHAPSTAPYPRWSVELLHCRDGSWWQGSQSMPRRFVVEWRHDQGLVTVPAALADRPVVVSQTA